MVADRPEDRLMQTMASAPRSAWRRNAASNAPGDGAAVSGSSLDDRQVDAVGVLDRAEPDRQRHHLDPELLRLGGLEVGGRVGDDSHRHDGRP
jgi:hypothetical protein